MKTAEMSELANKRWWLYGVDNNVFVLKQKGCRTIRFFRAVKATEAGEWSYPDRSYLARLEELTSVEAKDVVRWQQPVAAVICDEFDDQGGFTGICFKGIPRGVDRGHAWLKVGTKYSCECSSFVFSYLPLAVTP